MDLQLCPRYHFYNQRWKFWNFSEFSLSELTLEIQISIRSEQRIRTPSPMERVFDVLELKILHCNDDFCRIQFQYIQYNQYNKANTHPKPILKQIEKYLFRLPQPWIPYSLSTIPKYEIFGVGNSTFCETFGITFSFICYAATPPRPVGRLTWNLKGSLQASATSTFRFRVLTSNRKWAIFREPKVENLLDYKRVQFRSVYLSTVLVFDIFTRKGAIDVSTSGSRKNPLPAGG